MSTSFRNRERQRAAQLLFSRPLAYLITFRCYGTLLRGDAGAVDRQHNRFGAPTLPTHPRRAFANFRRLRHTPYRLDHQRRALVLEALRLACQARGWLLIAAHVRCTHVHCVVAAEVAPELILATLKAFASRKIRETLAADENQKHWSRHGSTRYLWKRERLNAAIDYVVNRQGPALAVFSMPQGLSGSRCGQ